MVTADSIYGVSEVEMALRRTGKGYVLGVNANSQFNSWGAKPEVSGTADAIAQSLDAAAWQRLSAGSGTNRSRRYDWAYLELADLDADEFNPGLTGTWTRDLLIRRNLADGECAFVTTWRPRHRHRKAGPGQRAALGGNCQGSIGFAGGIRLEGIEDSFEAAKTELGLDRDETRPWHGWHRHVSLVMRACALLATIRHHANQPASQKHGRCFPGCPTPHPLVGPGTSPRRHPSRAAPHPAHPRQRLVALAQGAPSRRTTLLYETQTATVMLGRRAGAL